MNRLRQDNPPTLVDDGFLDDPAYRALLTVPPSAAPRGCAWWLVALVLWLVVG